jgi:hypothetical protein
VGDLYLGLDHAAHTDQDQRQLASTVAAPRTGQLRDVRGRIALDRELCVVRSATGRHPQQLDIDEDVRTIFTVPSTGVIGGNDELGIPIR